MIVNVSADESLFNTRLPKEIQVGIFMDLPAVEIILSVGLVCKQWKEIADNYFFSSLPCFPKLKTNRIQTVNNQWKRFENFIKSTDFSVNKKSFILFETRQVFREGVALLDKKYEKGKTKNHDFANRMNYDRAANPNLFELFLTFERFSIQLNSFMKTLLIMYTKRRKRNVISRAILFDYSTNNGDDRFIKFLIKNYPELSKEQQVFSTLFRQCTRNKNSNLLKVFIKELFEHQGKDIDQETEIVILETIKNEKSLLAKKPRGTHVYQIDRKEIKEFINELKGHKKNKNKNSKTTDISRRCLIQ